jgi:hypothetical protein
LDGIRVSLVKGIANGRDDLTLEVVQVRIWKCLVGIAAPRDSYVKGLVVATASLELTGKLLARA